MAIPRVVLVDLDDTILRDSVMADPCWERACALFADCLEGLGPGVLKAQIRRTADWYWSDAERSRQGRLDLTAARRAIVRSALADLHLGTDTLADAIADTYVRLREEEMAPFPGAVEALRALQEQGRRLGLITNGAALAQRRKLERFQLSDFFAGVFIEEELGYGKPDPRVFRLALAALQASPAEAWMIGNDLAMDIVPAVELGIRAIWVDHAGAGVPAGPVSPWRVVSSLAEVLEFA